jgi:site-specific DNA recombinase
VKAIARGRRWLDEIVIGSVTAAEQWQARQCTVRQVNLTLSLAFLAPQLVKGAVEGRLPRGINIERVRDLSAEWECTATCDCGRFTSGGYADQVARIA